MPRVSTYHVGRRSCNVAFRQKINNCLRRQYLLLIFLDPFNESVPNEVSVGSFHLVQQTEVNELRELRKVLVIDGL